MVKSTVTENNIHIDDSYAVPKKNFGRILTRIHVLHPECKVFERKTICLEHEWATHNALYDLGLWKDRTKDVDLNVPMPWYKEWAYFIVGALVWVFIP